MLTETSKKALRHPQLFGGEFAPYGKTVQEILDRFIEDGVPSILPSWCDADGNEMHLVLVEGWYIFKVITGGGNYTCSFRNRGPAHAFANYVASESPDFQRHPIEFIKDERDARKRLAEEGSKDYSIAYEFTGTFANDDEAIAAFIDSIRLGNPTVEITKNLFTESRRLIEDPERAAAFEVAAKLARDREAFINKVEANAIALEKKLAEAGITARVSYIG